MRIIGLDLGSKRIGVALSNSDLTVATPYDVIQRADKIEKDHTAILNIADEWEVDNVSSELLAVDPIIQEDIFEILPAKHVVAARLSEGGTGFERVEEQLNKWRDCLVFAVK